MVDSTAEAPSGPNSALDERRTCARRRARRALDERRARTWRDAGGVIEAGQLLAGALMSHGRVVDYDGVLVAVQREAVTGTALALTATSRSSAVLWVPAGPEMRRTSSARAESSEKRGPWRNEIVGARAIAERISGHPIAALNRAEPLLAVDQSRGFVGAFRRGLRHD